MQSVIALINHYGYIILFIALVLELIALPLPGEFMMTYCGFLVYESKMNWIISIVVSTTGVILGITISYFVGTRLGMEFLKKRHARIHHGPERFERMSSGFELYGNKLLVLAYFIPGIRHLTGYFSGIIEMPYKKFAPYAYFGALLWTTTFISLGKLLGDNWNNIHNYTTPYLTTGIIIIFLILIIIYVYRNYKEQIIQWIYKILNKTSSYFRSLEKIKVIIAVAAVVFLGFLILVIGITKDYLAHEFVRQKIKL